MISTKDSVLGKGEAAKTKTLPTHHLEEMEGVYAASGFKEH